MFLKTLTLKGFKSFAEKSALDFEPGVTVVVGPNGSGKSNLVDAVAWVLGAQGPRTLRGGKMDDVIFAGTAQRPALGRAEVSLTIDNSAGLLAIEFDEVTITRTLFRSGESEYQLNGVPCRLLDIQELLSDTGIGRQQHVIVGQGQLDAVLNSRPEDRRAVIEEAAGVLKYRKRREKAERRLTATEGNLLRLNDLVREVRRQLTPLQRQADAARRHDGVDAERRAIRLHLAGRELATLEGRLEQSRARRAELDASDRALRARLRQLDESIAEAERSLTVAGDDELADPMVRVEALRERGRGLALLVDEKERGYERQLRAAADAGVVDTLVADIDQLRRELDDLDSERAAVDPSRDALDDRERGIADRRAAQHELEATGEPAVTRDQRRGAEATVMAAAGDVRAAEGRAARARARADALGVAFDRVRTAAGADHLAGTEGVLGSLVDQLEIDAGAELAVSSALGEALYAVVVDGGETARHAFEKLTRDERHATLLVVDPADRTQGELAPPGTRPLAELVRCRRPELEGVVARLLMGCVLVEGDWRAALDVSLANPGVVVVTSAGARVGGSGPWRTTHGGEITRPAVDEALAEAERAERDLLAAEQQHERALVSRDEAARAEHAASDASSAAWAAIEADAHALALERRELDVQVAALDARRAVLEHRLAEVGGRLDARDDSARAQAHERRNALVGRLEVCQEIGRRLERHQEAVSELHTRFAERRRLQSEAARASAERLEALRAERRNLEEELARAREHVGRSEIDEAETKLRLENAVERLRADFDCEPETARSAAAPEVPDGTTLAGRARELERELKLMGPINPLALQEYEALHERHEFLQRQLDDVKESRRELQRVIRAIDHEIVAVFETAFADVQQHFAALFTTLFPGGSGRVFLTEPDDPLNTGIEIEARPSGKNVRRLSLLSGGERSLTALAFLFAVFRARPSPFYLLDEVEAALDDVNLHRFLDLVHEFREEAQLLIVSHQKRTMEAADSLYGVSMPPGGSTRVVSQRLDEELVLD